MAYSHYSDNQSAIHCTYLLSLLITSVFIINIIIAKVIMQGCVRVLYVHQCHYTDKIMLCWIYTVKILFASSSQSNTGYLC